MRIWIDITNTPHVNIIMPIYNYLKSKGHDIFITARDFSETIPLLESNGIHPIIIGGYKGKSRINKVLGLIQRMYYLMVKIPKFDLAFSLGGNYTATIAKLRGKKSITFSDNDISYKGPSFRFSTYFIFPSYFNSSLLEKKYKVDKSRIFKFNGFKEDIYIANYTPDPQFLNKLPFDEFITIRPENLKASYVPKDSVTIVPDLFKEFKNENILFLPRYKEERSYAKGFTNIYIPDGPLPGLDVCYYTKAMLTGAGTFARESAILGTPAVSFFPGKIFLTVDTIMQQKGWEFKSRDPKEIFKYVRSSEKDIQRKKNSSQVLNEVLNIFDQIISEID